METLTLHKNGLRRWATAAAVALVASGLIGITPQAAAVPFNAAIDTTDKEAVRQAYLNTYLPAMAVPVGWSGSVADCVAGAPSAEAKEAVVSAMNYMRAMAGLAPISEDATISDTYTQKAALIMQAEGDARLDVNGYTSSAGLSHARPSTWPCWSAEGANPFPTGSGAEIISYMWGNSASAADHVPNWMADGGTPSLGHRSAILSSGADTVGIGLTTNYAASHVIGGGTPATGSYSWPSKGYFPAELLAATVDDSGIVPDWNEWSYYPAPGCDVTGATVAVTKNGAAVTLGSAGAAVQDGIGWRMPVAAAPARGLTDAYQVTVSGITGTGCAASDSYGVDVFNASELPAATVDSVEITGAAKVGQQVSATVVASPTDAALAYSWKVGGVEVGTAATYMVAPGDLGGQLTLVVSATKQGYEDATPVTSTAVTVGQGTMAAGTPTISGEAMVGQTLTAATGTWTPTVTDFTYTWKADGGVVGGNTVTYALTAADLGKTITVDVTGALLGYGASTKSSAAVGPVVAAPGGDVTTIPGGDTTGEPSGPSSSTAPSGDTTGTPGSDSTTVPGGHSPTTPGGDSTSAPGSDSTAAPTDGATLPAPSGSSTSGPSEGPSTQAPSGGPTGTPSGNSTGVPGSDSTTVPGGDVTGTPGGNSTLGPSASSSGDSTVGATQRPSDTSPSGTSSVDSSATTTVPSSGTTTTAASDTTVKAPTGGSTTSSGSTGIIVGTLAALAGLVLMLGRVAARKTH